MARNHGLSARRKGIRALFLHREESYSLREAAQIVGVSSQTLIREAEEDCREAYRDGGEWRFTWRQLAFIGLRRWSIAQIHDALGADAASVLPPLLALRAITVRLPEYMLRALETVAADNGISLDEYLCGELIDFAGTMSSRLTKRIPGFRRAYLFPGRE